MASDKFLRKNELYINANGIQVQYINDKRGMRQNFLLHEPPDGNGAVRIDLRIQTKGCSWVLHKDENTIAIQDETGLNELMRYTDLRCWDADGNDILAQMVELGPNEVSILFSDRGYRYPIFVDPLNLVRAWAGPTNPSGSKFGYAVSGVGSLYQGSAGGVMVGAPYFDTVNYTDAGKVFVYSFENGPPPASPTWTKEGENAYDHFGWSVADAGDVDRNNYSDIIIGAPDYDSTGYSNDGKAYIFGGSSTGLSNTPLWTKVGNQNNAHLGWVVSSGDFKDNGFGDVVVGAPDYDYGFGNSDNGAVHVFYSQSGGPSTSPSWSQFGASGAQFGFSIAKVNVNGGADDLLIGAPSDSSFGSNRGAVYLYLGLSNNSGLSSSVATYAGGENSGDKFGFSVSDCADTNGDNYGDILVGAPNYGSGALLTEGKVYLYRGNSSGFNGGASWTPTGGQAGAKFGYAVTGGNVDTADSLGDVVIAAPFFDYGGGTDNGKVWFYRGQSGGNPTLDTQVISTTSGENLGFSVSYGNPITYSHAGFIIGGPSTSSGGAYVYEWTE
ncbi:MAG: hypothetical protein AB1813_09430 [Verrucomicrobiota bacterium]